MSLRRLLDFRLLLAAIAVVGVAAFIADTARNRDTPRGSTHYERIDAFIEDQMRASRIPGAAVAIVEDSEIVHARGFGQDGRGNAVTPDTPFWIGSNTKSVTALAVNQLIEAGRVELDAPVQRYLTEFRLADEGAAERITVRHLLNQTSGLSRADGMKLAADAGDQSLEETVAGMRDLHLNRPAGASYQYSNYNFVLLGLLVERVSGMSWQEYVESRVFAPLGMTHSYTSLEAAVDNGLTQTHRYAFGLTLPTEGEYRESIAPTGYLYSTASDMARYLSLYLEGGELNGARLLSDEGIKVMLTPATNTARFPLDSHVFEAQYGEGWFVGPFGAATDARWHQGALPQFVSWMVLLPDTRQAVVLLVNANSQMEFFGANSTFSRLPIGVVNVLRGELPPAGPSTTRFYIVFDTVVALAIAVQVWSLVRVARRPALPLRAGPAGAIALVPMLWEVAFATLLLVGFPTVLGAGWRAVIFALPDLSIVVIAISLLWLTTGAVRVWRIVSAMLAVRRVQHDRRPAGHGALGFRS